MTQTLNIPVLKQILLNIFKDLSNLSSSFDKDKCTKDVLKSAYKSRKSYVKKYATDEGMSKYLTDWYKYYFGCINQLLNEAVEPSTLAEFYKVLYAFTDKYFVTNQLSNKDIDSAGVMAGKGLEFANRYKEDSFPRTWFEVMVQYLFEELLMAEGKKSA